MLTRAAATPDETNEQIRRSMTANAGFRWFLQHGMFTFGQTTPLAFLLALSDYRLDGLAERITTPTLVIVGESDHFLTVDAQTRLYEALTAPKALLRFTAEEAAGDHCQMGAITLSNQRILDWLDERLGG